MDILWTNDAWFCDKTCLGNSFEFARENCISASGFFQRNENESTEHYDEQDMSRFYHASVFYTSNNIVNDIDE